MARVSSEPRAAAMSEPRPDRRGTLVLIVGPSGAGKDTVIRLAAANLSREDGYVFPRRLVTRPPDDSESNLQIDEATFCDGERAGSFALSWRAHGHCYALPRDVIGALEHGHIVVINVSRRVIAEARARFPDVRVVSVTAAPDVLAARLGARGRDPDTSARLARDAPQAETGPALVIENDGPPEDAGDRLTGFLRALRSG